MASLSCVCDANTLYPAQLRDLLMWLALKGLVRAHWTDRIHREWMESLLNNRPATANSPRALLDVLEKLRQLQNWDVPTWDLSALNPNRRKMPTRLGRKYSNYDLQRMGPERRYPILLAFLKRTFTDALDEAADIFSECLAGAHKRAKRALREHNQAIADATQEKVRLFAFL